MHHEGAPERGHLVAVHQAGVVADRLAAGLVGVRDDLLHRVVRLVVEPLVAVTAGLVARAVGSAGLQGDGRDLVAGQERTVAALALR